MSLNFCYTFCCLIIILFLTNSEKSMRKYDTGESIKNTNNTQVFMYVWCSQSGTVKPVCNDHLSNKIYYMWFIH